MNMKVLSFGEVLWDVYPHHADIGGAPLNFAAHLAGQGGEVSLISAVGKDPLGADGLARIREFGVDADWVATLPAYQTGQCLVTLDEKGIPSYRLLDRVAYDHIPLPDLKEPEYDALYFGSLALRHAANRRTLGEILARCSFREVFVDINLRPPFVSLEALKTAFTNATVMKISQEELPGVTDLLFGETCEYTAAAERICREYPRIQTVLITRGEKGAYAFNAKTGAAFTCPAAKAEVVSTLGAGDSFSAAFLYGYLSGYGTDICLQAASALAAFVVSRAEAIPKDTLSVYSDFQQ